MKKIRLNFYVVLFVLLINNIFAQIPTNGLVAYYPFNGNANDESGSGNNGTVNGATLTTDRFGNPNSAYLFNGINNYIIIPNVIINPNSSGTISLWFNLNNLYPGYGGSYFFDAVANGVGSDWDGFSLGFHPRIIMGII